MPFFKLYKPKTYNYRPIYYDPVKEARKKREAKFAKKENGEGEKGAGGFQTTLKRGSFREEFEKNSKVRREYSRKSNTRLIIILAILAAIIFWILS